MSNCVRFIFSVIPLVLVTPCVAHSGPQHAPKQQTSFSMQEPLERPVALPSRALEALETSKLSAQMLRDCAENEGIKVSEIPASWFAASGIELSSGRPSGLVVRAEHGCFWGAHVTQFWLLSKAGTQYQVVFTGRADVFRVLSRRTNGYRNVQLVFATKAGAEISYITFEYTKGKYMESDGRTEQSFDNK